MRYVCQRRCFFNKLYKEGDVVTDERVYKALKRHFKPEGESEIEMPKPDKEVPKTFTELATKDKPKLPEIPDVLGKPKTAVRRTSKKSE